MTRALPALAVIVPLGIYTKFYRGPAAAWVNDPLGSVLYEIAWCLVAAIAVPRCRPGPIALGVLAATCALEVLQLWHPPFLEWLRSFFLGRLVLGTTFIWSDFAWYAVGSVAGYALLTILLERHRKP
jgi:uncharacterized protein DUF2809